MRFYFEPPAPRKTKSSARRLLVRCPATAKLTSVGEISDAALWDDAPKKSDSPKKSGRFTCPHCQGVHSWVKKDVLLAR
jgi:hypothetical protein